MNDAITIIGGGWAGLACGVELAAAGLPVRLYESAPQLGGRARSVTLDDMRVDNGQHLLIGAYRETLALLRRLGMPESTQLVREPLDLLLLRDGAPLHLATPPLPAPLHLLWALWQGLRGEERRAALRFCLRAYRGGFRADDGQTVGRLLADQPASLMDALWRPLCLATLNCAPETASARLFLRVLRDAFAHRRRDSDLLHPRRPLGELVPEPARRFIEGHGGEVGTGHRVSGLRLEGGRVSGVVLGQECVPARQVVMATAPWHAARLLQSHGALQSLAADLQRLGSMPIATLYLRYSPRVTLGRPLLGLSGSQGQWVFDRGILCNQHGLLAVVISGDGPHMNVSADVLAEQLVDELAALFPHWPRPVQRRLVRERRATFHAAVESEPWRPGNATPVTGLWLAGDYTATGYPATLEGAVRSGVQCARQIIRQTRRSASGPCRQESP